MAQNSKEWLRIDPKIAKKLPKTTFFRHSFIQQNKLRDLQITVYALKKINIEMVVAVIAKQKKNVKKTW
jgi:hypothetical protein